MTQTLEAPSALDELLAEIDNSAAPAVAKSYYESSDMYVFDEFQTGRVKGSRRPHVVTLYDVFCCIRDDEAEHVKTMALCQDPEVLVRSPNTEAAFVASALSLLLLSYVGDQLGTGLTAPTAQMLTDVQATTDDMASSVEGVLTAATGALSADPASESAVASQLSALSTSVRAAIVEALEALSKLWPLL